MYEGEGGGGGMKQYATIVIDPPWNETGGGKIKRGADKHYKLMKHTDMPEAIRKSGVFNPAENCHLYLWATANHLPQAMWLIEQLGFTYKTNVVWAKEGRIGLGQYFRMKHEHLLFAVRGKGFAVRTDDRTIPSIVSAKRGGHSAKPVEAYEMIERRAAGPWLDMFARREREGWTVWGDEV
jgi:N6-adenosine-specific RNA methylase IME4